MQVGLDLRDLRRIPAHHARRDDLRDRGEVDCQPALENASPQPVRPSSVSTLTSTVCTSFFGCPPA